MFKNWCLLFSLLFAIAYSLCAGQFTYPWNFYNTTGGIQDMHFMPGTNESQFIYLTEGNFAEIRETQTGALIKQIPGVQGLFGFTADSQKIVTMMGSRIELHNLADMKLLAYDSLKLGTDTVDSHGNKMATRFLGLAIDPIRPYAYAIVQKYNLVGSIQPYRLDTVTIVAYDYNEMKQIKVLNPEGFKTHEGAAKIAVSKDGKYLAAFTDRQTDLKIWLLDSMKLIRDVQLFDPFSNIYCQPNDLKFSEQNTDNIYFVGKFTNINFSSTIQKYSIKFNSIIDSTFKNTGYFGNLTFFDNEQRVLYLTYPYNFVLNFLSGSTEFKKDINLHEPGSWNWCIYSKNYDLFIGTSGAYCSSGKYDRISSKIDNPVNINILYPNPTSDFIEISDISPMLKHGVDNSYIKIYNIFGQIMSTPVCSADTPASGGQKIDISDFAPGMYFVRIGVKVSKFVKI